MVFLQELCTLIILGWYELTRGGINGERNVPMKVEVVLFKYRRGTSIE